MIGLVAAWVVVVAVVLGLIARPWRAGLNRSAWAIAPAALIAAWVLGIGAIAYDDMMTKGQWTGATLAIPFIAIKAALFSALTYFLVFSILKARASESAASKRWALPSVLAVVCLYLYGSDALSVRAMFLERHAADTALRAEDVTALATRVRTGQASEDEAQAFIANPLCPPDILQSAVSHSIAYRRLAATRNPNISVDDLVKLSHDENYEVRLYALYNDRLPISEYPRLARDPNEHVREAMTWKDALPDDDFTNLLFDDNESVRKSAESRWTYRQGPSEEAVAAAFQARQPKP